MCVYIPYPHTFLFRRDRPRGDGPDRVLQGATAILHILLYVYYIAFGFNPALTFTLLLPYP